MLSLLDERMTVKCNKNLHSSLYDIREKEERANESLRNFCAIEAASATRLSSENKGESSIRSPGVLLNSIKY
jgi:hypothetical protein